jgi:hypothetical protein
VYVVLWWLPAGTIPTLADAVQRLEWLRRDGPSPDAFMFRSPFPPPGESSATEEDRTDWTCAAS